MTSDSYHTLAGPAEAIYKEKSSKFLAYAYPVESEEEIRTLLDALRFDEFIFGLKELDAFFHFGLDLLERDRHFFAWDDVMRRRVDGDML